MVERDSLGLGVDLSLKSFGHDEFTDLLEDEWLLNLKLLVDALDTDGLILVLTVDKENLKSYLLDLLEKGGLKSSRLELSHFVEDFDAANVFVAFLPFALVEVSGSEDDEVTAGLWHKLDTLLVVLLNELPEVSVDHLLLDDEAVLADVWNLKEH